MPAENYFNLINIVRKFYLEYFSLLYRERALCSRPCSTAADICDVVVIGVVVVLVLWLFSLL